MEHIDTAFKQLAFAWKLYHYALDGKINVKELDCPITFQGAGMIFVLPDKIFDSNNEMIVALENNLVIAFGAAAIALNRGREEAQIRLADPIQTEIDQFAGVVYQIRNAFAHNIAEPRWNITNLRFARVYQFGSITIDLSGVGTRRFEYQDIGGPEVLFWLKEYGQSNAWAYPFAQPDTLRGAAICPYISFWVKCRHTTMCRLAQTLGVAKTTIHCYHPLPTERNAHETRRLLHKPRYQRHRCLKVFLREVRLHCFRRQPRTELVDHEE